MSKTPAERSADYRARKAKEKAAEQDAARADARANASRDARDALEASVTAAQRWLAPSDAGMVQQARSLARLIDEARYRDDERTFLAASGLYTRTLDLLGLTPARRHQLELRVQRVAAAEPVPARATAPNVTLIRPPKRDR